MTTQEEKEEAPSIEESKMPSKVKEWRCAWDALTEDQRFDMTLLLIVQASRCRRAESFASEV